MNKLRLTFLAVIVLGSVIAVSVSIGMRLGQNKIIKQQNQNAMMRQEKPFENQNDVQQQMDMLKKKSSDLVAPTPEDVQKQMDILKANGTVTNTNAPTSQEAQKQMETLKATGVISETKAPTLDEIQK